MESSCLSLGQSHRSLGMFAQSFLTPRIFAARYLKDKLGDWWFRIHLFLMLGITGVGSIAALTLIILFSPRPYFANDKYSHKILGLTVSIVLLLQVILGFVSHLKFKASRTRISWFDRAHWYIGRASFILALVTCYCGLEAYGSSRIWKIAFIAWVGAGLLMFVLGEWLIGKVNHVAKEVPKGLVGDRSASLSSRTGTGRSRKEYRVRDSEYNSYPVVRESYGGKRNDESISAFFDDSYDYEKKPAPRRPPRSKY
jgi:hypothetical protein